jgi:uncharacterized membrane protein
LNKLGIAILNFIIVMLIFVGLEKVDLFNKLSVGIIVVLLIMINSYLFNRK